MMSATKHNSDGLGFNQLLRPPRVSVMYNALLSHLLIAQESERDAPEAAILLQIIGPLLLQLGIEIITSSGLGDVEA